MTLQILRAFCRQTIMETTCTPTTPGIWQLPMQFPSTIFDRPERRLRGGRR
jgi:hypothetical protein